jgi:hypothetical protein
MVLRSSIFIGLGRDWMIEDVIKELKQIGRGKLIK